MNYITGIHALNIECSLNTCGDWHTSALRWKNINFAESNNRFFEDYGIESNKKIPGSDKKYFVANHIRALLDLLEDGNFAVAQGMNDDFICNSKYDDEIFNKVLSMKALEHWNDIDTFMGKEYKMKWIKFKEENK